ncbi:MbtH family protein [Streptomyces sp. DSM 42041]|uniref:MbtH family protein n=1 Tax=Streptomyces hazeniae TaxID=3075538 RepID=A0ABU2NYS6_9ACTN|nr:MbtH family protein [Streptomyces sp. DSM 42041]MDT0381353.1 MbtH family protein [Streptomyces sp. DSM 42041]
MTNPFENDDTQYLVLTNHETQHSLWPADLEVPAGWETQHGPDERTACLAYIEENWRDMRPASLIADMAKSG